VFAMYCVGRRRSLTLAEVGPEGLKTAHSIEFPKIPAMVVVASAVVISNLRQAGNPLSKILTVNSGQWFS
jgi:hypothetical protein